jgi:cell division protein FtsQ
VTASPKRRVRRDLGEDFAGDFADDPYDDDDPPAVRRRAGVRVRFRGLPTTKWGRIFAGCVVVLLLGFCLSVYLMAKSYLLHDERFVIPSSSSIEFEGNTHVTRAQLLGIFGQDVERNIFTVSLDQRRAELEKLPWVAHATVMRLLPNRMRVSIVERTPVAFVRQGSHIGLVDANGVLLDMPVDSMGKEHYSFPVVTGISANDPLSTRAARMKIYQRFTSDLDGSGEAISQELSEVDLSNPEDVKALIPDHSTDILVHFGEDDFLDRYRRFKEHLPEWRAVYPKLYSVDMRYERQVVLEMQPGSGVPVTPAASASDDSSAAKAAPPVAAKPVVKAAAKPTGKVVETATPKATATAKPSAKAAIKVPAVGAKPAPKTAAPVQTQNDVAFDVPANKSGAKKTSSKAKAHAAPAKHPPVVANPPDVPTQYHPPQVVHP